MSRKTRALVAVVAVVGVAAVLVGGWIVTRPDSPPAPGGDGLPSRQAAGAPPRSEAPPSEHVLNDTEHGAGRDYDTAAEVWYLQLSTLPLEDVTRFVNEGVGSDLPDDRRRAASDAAARFVVADLSGVGRDQFPTWWDGSTAAPPLACCRDVVMLAAGAASYPDEAPLVLALVVWSATPVDGVSQFDAWEASFVFLHPAPDGSYTPVDPSTVESWRAPSGLGLPAP
jgi:hypothetical protein